MPAETEMFLIKMNFHHIRRLDCKWQLCWTPMRSMITRTRKDEQRSKHIHDSLFRRWSWRRTRLVCTLQFSPSLWTETFKFKTTASCILLCYNFTCGQYTPVGKCCAVPSSLQMLIQAPVDPTVEATHCILY